MLENDLDCLLVCDPHERRYLTGYNSVYPHGVVVLSHTGSAIVTYPAEAGQAQFESGMEVFVYEGARFGATIARAVSCIAGETKPGGRGRIGLSAGFSVSSYLAMVQNGLQFVPSYDILPSVRAVKSAWEIEGFVRAAKEHDMALKFAETVIEEGVTEHFVRAQIDSFLLNRGAEGFTFETVVLSGHRSAYPHCRPASKTIESGDLVTVDFGALFNGCDGDVCRSYFMGPVDSELADMYNVLVEAQKAAVSKCVPGNTGHDVDKAAREVISNAGWGSLFTHGVGHGLGGGPNLSPGSQDVLKQNMIVAVEPAIYIPGKGGMRYENDVLITDSGPQYLTGYGGAWLERVGL